MNIPAAYLVKRDLSGDLLSAVLDAVLIHPVCCSVVFEYSDVELGRKLSESVVFKTEKPEDLIWLDSEAPVAFILAQDAALIAVYSDGTRETLL